tara:strand:- start:52 stop:288 length:237 start_codon:yes stop_codon:yes gene_type:complete
MTTNTRIQFTQKYNPNIDRPVYYAKSNTVEEEALINHAVAHFGIREWSMACINSGTHQYAIKLIDTDTGDWLDTDAHW